MVFRIIDTKRNAHVASLQITCVTWLEASQTDQPRCRKFANNLRDLVGGEQTDQPRYRKFANNLRDLVGGEPDRLPHCRKFANNLRDLVGGEPDRPPHCRKFANNLRDLVGRGQTGHLTVASLPITCATWLDAGRPATSLSQVCK